MRQLLWLLLALLLPIEAASALGEQYGRVAGIVYSPEGAELSGVKLSLTSPNLLGGPRITFSAEDGSYGFNNLPPGKYELEVSSDGLKTYTKSGIVVSVGKTSALYIAMTLTGYDDGRPIDTGNTTYRCVAPGELEEPLLVDPSVLDNSLTPLCAFSAELPEYRPLVWPVMQDLQRESLQKLPKEGQSLQAFVLEFPRAEVKNSALRMNGAAATIVIDGQRVLPQMSKSQRR